MKTKIEIFLLYKPWADKILFYKSIQYFKSTLICALASTVDSRDLVTVKSARGEEEARACLPIFKLKNLFYKLRFC